MDFEHKRVLDADKSAQAMLGFSVSCDDACYVVNPRVTRGLSLGTRAADRGS